MLAASTGYDSTVGKCPKGRLRMAYRMQVFCLRNRSPTVVFRLVSMQKFDKRAEAYHRDFLQNFSSEKRGHGQGLRY